MRRFLAAICALASFVATTPSWASDDRARAQGLAVEAGRAYETGEYFDAIEGYRDALDAGFDNGVIHYNLGNAYFKGGELGEAIASYLRALRRNPRDREAQANLERAQSLIRDEALAPLEVPIFLRPLQWLYSSLSLNEWAVLALMFLGLFCAVGAITAWLPPHRRPSRLAFGGLGAVALTCFLMSGIHYRFEIGEATAVVVAGEVDVRSGPGEGYNLAFKVHEGLVVYVDDRRPEWTRITLGGELVGWVPSEQIEEI